MFLLLRAYGEVSHHLGFLLHFRDGCPVATFHPDHFQWSSGSKWCAFHCPGLLTRCYTTGFVACQCLPATWLEKFQFRAQRERVRESQSESESQRVRESESQRVRESESQRERERERESQREREREYRLITVINKTKIPTSIILRSS